MNLFDKDTINKATEITLWERVKLLFRSKKHYIDNVECVKVVYKVLGGKVFVLDISDIPPMHYNCRCRTLDPS